MNNKFTNDVPDINRVYDYTWLKVAILALALAMVGYVVWHFLFSSMQTESPTTSVETNLTKEEISQIRLNESMQNTITPPLSEESIARLEESMTSTEQIEISAESKARLEASRNEI